MCIKDVIIRKHSWSLLNSGCNIYWWHLEVNLSIKFFSLQFGFDESDQNDRNTSAGKKAKKLAPDYITDFYYLCLTVQICRNKYYANYSTKQIKSRILKADKVAHSLLKNILLQILTIYSLHSETCSNIH